MILGIVGSPRKGKLTDQLVTQALVGAGSGDVKTIKAYLADYKIPSYSETTKECPEELSRLCEEAGAIIIGAPVYWGDINGLTKDFMDTVRIRNANGKWALGVSIAGGSGKGLCIAIQSIYSFFYHRQIRGIDPTPVSRFNFQEALQNLERSGKELAKLSTEPKPFCDLWDRVQHFDKLEYMDHTFLDEMLLLAEHLIKISKDNPALPKAMEKYDVAKSLKHEGKTSEAAVYAVAAYDDLFF